VVEDKQIVVGYISFLRHLFRQEDSYDTLQTKRRTVDVMFRQKRIPSEVLIRDTRVMCN